VAWTPLFRGFDNTREITITGWRDGNEQHSVRITLLPSISTKFSGGTEATLDLSKATNGVSSDTVQLSGAALQQEYTNPEGQSQVSRMIVEPQGIRVEPPANAWILGVLLPARYRPNPQEDAERFGQTELGGDTGELLEALKIVEPRLKRLTTVFSAGVATIYGDVGMGRMIPLSYMGDGIGRFASVLLAVATASNGVVLVDEVDTGLHHSILSKAWSAVSDAARRYNVQVIATTHSFEFIQAAYRAFASSDRNPFRLHRLERTQEGIQAVSYDEEALAAAMEAELEVR
jgi:hypothetical protein